MQTRVSTKGQIVLPGPLRRKLGIRPGDPLDIAIEGGNIVLRPREKPSNKAHIIKHPVTGLPVLTVGADAPLLTSQEVEEILTNFP